MELRNKSLVTTLHTIYRLEYPQIPIFRSAAGYILLCSNEAVPYTEKRRYMQDFMYEVYSEFHVFDESFGGCLDAPRVILDSGLAYVDLRGS